MTERRPLPAAVSVFRATFDRAALAAPRSMRTIEATMSQPFDLNPTANAVRPVTAAVAASDFAEAARLADEALAQGIIHPALFNARAIWLEHEGRDEDALRAFEQARALMPRDPRLLNAIGLCLTRLNGLEDAIRTFDAAISLDPAYPATHQRKGLALGLAGRLDEAEKAHKRATVLAPRYAEAWASLASIAARKGDTKAARQLAERALAIAPDEPTAMAALAMTDNTEGTFAEAERRTRSLLDSAQLAGHGRAVAYGLLADALDGQGRTDDAFAAYAAANSEQRKLHAPRFEDRPNASDVVESLTEDFAKSDADWKTSNDGGARPEHIRGHVFLLGFHRSGTTLLEQALAAHPGIRTLDERDFLADLASRYLTRAEGLSSLAALEGEELAVARAAYWARVGGEGLKLDGKVFVDKHPFNTVKLPLIAKLFPDAKIIFAVRDPRDVVLSCFRRQFDVDVVKFAFLSLEDTALLYDRVMAFADLCRHKLALSIFDHRHEDLIADFDAQTKRVCEFVGIPWDEGMRNFAEAARALAPAVQSAAQLRKGLNDEGVGQWRRYETNLAPVLPLLHRWIVRFGYENA